MNTAFTTGRIWRLGADIDTDVLAPGVYMKHGIETIARHCLESVRPDFSAGARSGDVIIAGPNFGIGSSREQAAGVLVHLGIRAVIAPTFSGLFLRNAFNLGLLLVTCDPGEAFKDGESVELRLQSCPMLTLMDGVSITGQPIPDFLLDMVRAGGLMNLLRKQSLPKDEYPKA